MPTPPSEPRDRYLEDYVVGVTEPMGSVSVDAGEIVDFARRYDPQPFHIDEAAARGSMFGGLIASGWQTASLMMGLLARSYLSQASSLGSPGVDEVRWLLPVRPGDTLTVSATPVESRVSRTKPDRGVLRTRIDVCNQDGRTVMTMTALNLVARRPA